MSFTRSGKKLLKTLKYKELLRRIARGVPVRQRYVLTRHNTVRLRYMVAPAFAVMFLTFGVASSFLPRMNGYAAQPVQVAVNNTLTNEDSNFVPAPYKEEEAATSDEQTQASEDITTPAPVAAAPAVVAAVPAVQAQTQPQPQPQPQVQPQQVAQAQPQPRDATVKIGPGDTLDGVLEDAGVSSADAYSAIQTLSRYLDPRSITPGQKLSLHFEPAGDSGAYNFSRLVVPVSMLNTVQLSKNNDGTFAASVDKKEAVRKLYARKADVDVSLFGSALEAHIPAAVIAKAIRIYSWNVDFQRDIQPGDSLKVMYEQYETPDGTPIRTGEIVYASLTVNGNENPIYRYQTKDGDVDYFNPDGVSIRKALLSTPVDGARISSGYGVRVHPVLGYTKMHKGVDFAAPIGTPIYAAGNGTIEKIGPFSTYGNYVRIRHNSTLKTAYAHMLRFASGLRDGVKVRQGQVIGYIGVTGRSTGPHLHYEVLINDEQVNPHSVKVAQGDALKGAQLAAFKTYVGGLYKGYEAMLAQKYAAIAPAAGQQDTLR